MSSLVFGSRSTFSSHRGAQAAGTTAGMACCRACPCRSPRSGTERGAQPLGGEPTNIRGLRACGGGLRGSAGGFDGGQTCAELPVRRLILGQDVDKFRTPHVRPVVDLLYPGGGNLGVTSQNGGQLG